MNKIKEAIWKTEREREQIPNAMLLKAPTTLGSQPHEQLQKTHVPIHSKQDPRQVPTHDLIHEAHILNPKAKLLLQV
jgi:hypothetical protein